MTGWRPSASQAALEAAAELRNAIRAWMTAEHQLEVVTPVLSSAATSDPALQSYRVENGPAAEPAFLHTSPEFAMKRLIAAYQRDIYQLTPVFRGDERGHLHCPEFTMLEWYRIGRDHVVLMADMRDLLQTLWDRFEQPVPAFDTVSHETVVNELVGGYVDEISVGDIVAVFERRNRHCPPFAEDERDAALDLLIDTFLLPEFASDRLTFLIEYPVSQAALARIGRSASGRACAERFELYAGRVELANGFHELNDAVEQRRRFDADLETRRRRGLPRYPLDERLLAALESGLPDCAGVALGIERLLMVLLGEQDIARVTSFAWEND